MARLTAHRSDERHLLRRRRRRADRDRRRERSAGSDPPATGPTARTSARCCAQRDGRGRPTSAIAPPGPAASPRPRPRHRMRMPRRWRRSWPRTACVRASDCGRSAFTARPCCTGPNGGLTVQLGDGRALAARLAHPGGVSISAPPISRPAGRGRRSCRCSIARWCASSTGRYPVGVLNIGGVANVTFVDGEPISSPSTPVPAMR